jgi:WD40 repeat protein
MRDSVESAAFSPDGTRLVTGATDNAALIWDVHVATMSTKDLVTEVCTWRLRGLTRLSQLVDKIGYSTSKNASPIKGGNPKTWRSEDQVA